MASADNQQAKAVDAFLESYPPHIAAMAQRLREIVLRATPTAVERLRVGWRVIGYDLPNGRRLSYFAWIGPELEHVHVGWQAGTLMDDPDGVLRGAHIQLKKVRYLTFRPGDRIPAKIVADFTRAAARITLLPRGERELLRQIRAESRGPR